ncbi:receptor-like protein kinase HSL1 [Arachis stenosperma]|uniref:receptor-like protein kinase HSL1 n=1 Tax=Arachis stenosperma TaxID=217475 RepID=UPI0025ABF583|nr:receptor-like protein kinase HSL1 [Arachis stenosperma]
MTPPSRDQFPLLSSLLTFFLIFNITNSLLHDQEHQLLLRIKQYFHNPPSLSHWTPSSSSSSSHCSWPEITCNNDGSVTGITLSNANLNQTIPSFLCDLKNLTRVDFSQNFIPGDFPITLYNCSQLQYLDLHMNNFVGEVPDDIDTLSNLQYLNLASTNFAGDVPAAIGKLKELRVLRLQYCLFNGTLPDEIGDLSNLEFLDLSTNTMLPSTTLPPSWTRLKKLKIFYVFACNLVGEIPETIGEMVALEELDLSQNKLTGQIPSGLFKPKNLSIVYLSRNKLSGTIPDVIEASNLTIIDLTNNNLTGKIPNDFRKLGNLKGLKLSLNSLSGELPQSLGHLPALIDFRVFSNKLSGTLPSDFGRYSKLEIFLAGDNDFTGNLPEDLCYYGVLHNLTVYENNLNGELPESLGNCRTLQELKIQKNGFSGSIPSGLWTSFNLSNFIVAHNKFSGELPERLSANISRFDIGDNQFSGRIPAGVSSWTNVEYFDASKNNLTGSMPPGITALPKLLYLDLHQNQLTGPLPSDILSWKSLEILVLSQNKLSGQIPVSIGRLPALNMLDLSENQFSGQIPSLPSTLSNFNLSSNHLTGRIPSEFENSAYASCFLDNSGLCAATRVLNLALCNSSPQRQTKGLSWSLGLIISLVVIAIFLASLAAFLITRLYSKRKRGLDNSWKLISFQRLSFRESSIVSSLTENNIIGSGGYGTVYRVPVDGFGYVAVKKIWNNRKLNHRLESSFHAEVKILSNIRHGNIVKLLCCIFNEDSMLLVYEYLENHSLDKWLHKKSKSSSMSGKVNHFFLDWPKRLQIAIGIAQGLTYMHHDCSPPVVHRDVKTSNILLDSQFDAKVADFGLAKMMIKPLTTMTSVVGSFGYIAPEYVQTTKVSEKIDVFSFGVILLELTTGKEANYGDEHSSLSEWAWRHVQLGTNVDELLDTDVLEASYSDEMCSVFKLGVMCTSPLPAGRPQMKEALQLLHRFGEGYEFGERNIGKDEIIPLIKNSKMETRLDIDNDSD